MSPHPATPAKTSSRPLRVNLTKRLYAQLAAGLFVVSTFCKPIRAVGGIPQSIWKETVAEADRAEQWDRIVRAGAARRTAFVFSNQLEVVNFWANLHRMPLFEPRNWRTGDAPSISATRVRDGLLQPSTK